MAEHIKIVVKCDRLQSKILYLHRTALLFLDKDYQYVNETLFANTVYREIVIGSLLLSTRIVSALTNPPTFLEGHPIQLSFDTIRVGHIFLQ